MNDWHVVRGMEHFTYLKHDCPHENGRHWCSRNAHGWFCGLCKKYAPKEINDVADLAGCSPLTHYFNGRMTE